MFNVGDRVWITVGRDKQRGGTIKEINPVDCYPYLVEVDMGPELLSGRKELRLMGEKRIEDTTELHIAKKSDATKPDLSLLPRSAKEGISMALMDGEKKYGRYNYLKGMDWSRIISATDRHLSAFNDGEDHATDSKLNHLFHAGANIMILIEYYTKEIGNDNRYKNK